MTALESMASQRLLAYNSNKIEGGTLTEEQTASFLIPARFQNQMIITEQRCRGNERALLMFNKMLETIDQPFSARN